MHFAVHCKEREKVVEARSADFRHFRPAQRGNEVRNRIGVADHQNRAALMTAHRCCKGVDMLGVILHGNDLRPQAQRAGQRCSRVTRAAQFAGDNGVDARIMKHLGKFTSACFARHKQRGIVIRVGHRGDPNPDPKQMSDTVYRIFTRVTGLDG